MLLGLNQQKEHCNFFFFLKKINHIKYSNREEAVILPQKFPQLFTGFFIYFF